MGKTAARKKRAAQNLAIGQNPSEFFDKRRDDGSVVKKMKTSLERLSRDLRALAPCDSEIEMTMADDPIVANWRGASIFAASEAYPMHVVTKKEYKEGGHSLCRRRFLAQQCG